MSALIDSLVSRNLMVMLTPSGRGQLVSHNLYPEWELTQLQKQIAEGGYTQDDSDGDSATSATESNLESSSIAARAATTASRTNSNELAQALEALEDLKAQLNQLASRVEYLERELGVDSKSNS
jgi:hypothetical protein